MMKQLKAKAAALFSFLLIAVLLLTGSIASDTVVKAAAVQNQIEETYSIDVSSTALKKKKNDQNKKEVKADSKTDSKASAEITVEENGSYTSKEEVALYIHTYGKLPSNYITKKDAEKLGWQSSKGNLEEVAPGKSIGGSYFGNYEGLLPEAKNRKYYECDIDFEGGYRNAKRIIYSNDGLVYYTEDHYKSFEQLY